MPEAKMTAEQALKIMAEADESAWETWIWYGGPEADEYVYRSCNGEASAEERKEANVAAWEMYFFETPPHDLRRVLRACEILGVRSPTDRDWY